MRFGAQKQNADRIHHDRKIQRVIKRWPCCSGTDKQIENGRFCSSCCKAGFFIIFFPEGETFGRGPSSI